MSGLNRDELNEFRKKLINDIGLEKAQEMSAMVHKMGIMTAIYNLDGSKDFDAIAKEMHRIKDGILPVDQMKEIVEQQYPVLEEEGMIADGKLTHIAESIVEQYNEVLNQKILEVGLNDLPFRVISTREMKEALKQMKTIMFCVTPWYIKNDKLSPAATAVFGGKSGMGALRSYIEQGGLGAFQLQQAVEDADWERINKELIELRNKDVRCFKIDNVFVTLRPASNDEIKANFSSLGAMQSGGGGEAYAAYCSWVAKARGKYGFGEETKLANKMFEEHPEVKDIGKSFPCFLPNCSKTFKSLEELSDHAHNVEHRDGETVIPKEFIEKALQMITQTYG